MEEETYTYIDLIKNEDVTEMYNESPDIVCFDIDGKLIWEIRY